MSLFCVNRTKKRQKRYDSDARKLANRLKEMKKLYFIGIGGVSMAALARLCAALGYSVSGTDRNENGQTARLRAEGVPVTVGEGRVQTMPEVDLVVYSLAVPPTHPLLVLAAKKNIPVVSRPAFLGALQRRYPVSIGIAGMHGKSSTVGMCAEILQVAGKHPTVLSGADLSAEEGSYRRGDDGLLLFEACEYKDAFLHFAPTHAAVLNTEWEHTDYFRNLAAVRASFSAYLSAATLTYAVLSERERAFFSPHFAQTETFGEGGNFSAAEITAGDGRYSFSLRENGQVLGRVNLRVPGRFQVDNALAAAALCRRVGISGEDTVKGLCAYAGTARRMQRISLADGGAVYLDYAHHPTELAAALQTAKELGKGVVCVFQPHTYSRVASFHQAYADLLRTADFAGVLPIYAAREKKTLGMSGEKLAKEAHATFLPDFEAAVTFLLAHAGAGRTLLLAGAGDIEKVLTLLPLAEKGSTPSATEL